MYSLETHDVFVAVKSFNSLGNHKYKKRFFISNKIDGVNESIEHKTQF